MATKAVVVSRPRTRTVVIRSRRSRSRGETKVLIPIAVIGGFMPTVLEMIRQAQVGWSFRDIMSTPVYNYTGYSIPAGQWSARGLVNGWAPVLAGLIIHMMANRLGINRALARLTRGTIGI